MRLNRPALALLACVALLPPPPAVAQARKDTPSARELRQTYPLHESREPGIVRTSTPAPVPGARPPDAGTSQATLELVVAVILAIIGFAAGFVLAARPPRRRSAPANGSGAPETSAPQPSAAASPVWTAEIEWHAVDGKACFRAVARPSQGSAAVIVAESARLPWPPSGAGGVQALTAAAEQLETRLVAAGWRPLPPGDAWYAKRFAWEPVASTPAATGRFRRPAAWPENTQRLWRCEVELDAGSGDTRFRAVVRRPGDPHRHSVGTSTQLHDLTAALTAAGWESAGTGADWYSERFVWRGEGSPPDRLAHLSTPTGRAS